MRLLSRPPPLFVPLMFSLMYKYYVNIKAGKDLYYYINITICLLLIHVARHTIRPVAPPRPYSSLLIYSLMVGLYIYMIHKYYVSIKARKGAIVLY